MFDYSNRGFATVFFFSQYSFRPIFKVLLIGACESLRYFFSLANSKAAISG